MEINEYLEKFRDLEITKKELLEKLKENNSNKKNINPITIEIENVLKSINYFLTGRLSLEELKDWIKIVNFNEFYKKKEQEKLIILKTFAKLSEINRIEDFTDKKLTLLLKILRKKN